MIYHDRRCKLLISITDTCYVLAFSIIMLNTSLHNVNVKNKPDIEQFVNMNRGINDGGDLPRDLLEVGYIITSHFIGIARRERCQGKFRICASACQVTTCLPYSWYDTHLRSAFSMFPYSAF